MLNLAGELYPYNGFVLAIDASLKEQASAGFESGCHRQVESFSVFRVDYLLHKLGPVEWAILSRPAVNFIAAIVVPTGPVLMGIPVPDTEFRGFRCQAEFLLRLHDSLAGLHLP